MIEQSNGWISGDKNMIIAENARHGLSLASSTHVDPHAVYLESDPGVCFSIFIQLTRKL